MKVYGRQIKLGGLVLALTLLTSNLALAQHERPVQGYVFGAVGNAFGYESETRVGGGIGFEWLVVGGIGVGADLQVYGPTDPGVLLAADGSYHFRHVTADRKLVPFGTAGFSAANGCQSMTCGRMIGGFHFGGGVNYWYKPNRGWRVEFRHHVFENFNGRPTAHQPEVRIGFSF